MIRILKNNQGLKHIKKILSRKGNNRIHILLLLLILTLSHVFTHLVGTYAKSSENLQEKIADEIIRFHVVANSDSQEDQYLKYQVKDALIDELGPYLEGANNIEEARTIIRDNMSLIENVARKTILDMGYSYTVSASLSPSYFPMKVYGDYTFPPGFYQALQIHIGNAQGKNWWCVMFPPLCFVDETYNIVSEDSEEKLKYVLTDEEFESLKSKKTPVKIKFKLIEAIKKLFE